VFTRALHWSLSWARSIQSIPSNPISLNSILILFTHLRLGAEMHTERISCQADGWGRTRVYSFCDPTLLTFVKYKPYRYSIHSGLRSSDIHICGIYWEYSRNETNANSLHTLSYRTADPSPRHKTLVYDKHLASFHNPSMCSEIKIAL
jgi:hypothetical protein